MIDYILSIYRRIFGLPSPLKPAPKWKEYDPFGNAVNLSPSHLEDSLAAYADVEFGTPRLNTTNPQTAMPNQPFVPMPVIDDETTWISPAPKAETSTPETPAYEDKRIFDRDLKIEVKDGKFLG